MLLDKNSVTQLTTQNIFMCPCIRFTPAISTIYSRNRACRKHVSISLYLMYNNLIKMHLNKIKNLKINSITCKKLSIIVSGRKNVTQPFSKWK